MEKSNCFCAQNYIIFLFGNRHSGFSTPRLARPGLLSPLLRSVAEFPDVASAFLHGGLSVYPCRETVVPLQGNTDKSVYRNAESRCSHTKSGSQNERRAGQKYTTAQGQHGTA